MQRSASRAHHHFHGVAQHRRAAIIQAFGQRRIEASGILVEQPAHITFAHRRRRLAGSEPGELQPRAVIILRVGVAGALERRDRAVAVAKPVADGAEREPGGGEARRQLHRLRQNIRRAGKVAPRGMIERPFVAAVGDEIAGGNEQRAGVGHGRVIPGNLSNAHAS